MLGGVFVVLFTLFLRDAAVKRSGVVVLQVSYPKELSAMRVFRSRVPRRGAER